LALPLSYVTLAAVAALLWAERRGSARGKWLAKPIASAGFVGVALASGALDGAFGRAVLCALVLSFAGDVLLISDEMRWFRAGLLTFLLGHVAFAVAFLLRGVDARVAAAAALVLVAMAVVVARWLLPHVEPAMRAPVMAYVVVITVMVTLAAGSSALGRPRLLAAAAAFFVSDLSVARDRFVAPGFANRLWGLPLYYGAQLVFAASV
jgi:uncharacterized membrane protein YhhN